MNTNIVTPTPDRLLAAETAACNALDDALATQSQSRAADSMTLDQLQDAVLLTPMGRKREATLAAVDAWEGRAAELAARGLDYWRQ